MALQMLLLVNSVRRLFHRPARWNIGTGYTTPNDVSRSGRAQPGACWNAVSRVSDEGVVVFDWITKDSPVSVEWVETVVATRAIMGFGAVSLPHGDSPHANQLIRHHEWNLKPDTCFPRQEYLISLWCRMNYAQRVSVRSWMTSQLPCWAPRATVMNGWVNWRQLSPTLPLRPAQETGLKS